MVKNYRIRKINSSEYHFIVFSLNYNNPVDSLNSIGAELTKKNYTGKIIFDLLLSNGNTSNRYIEAYFDSAKFDFRSFKVLKKVAKDIKKISLDFYLSNYPIKKRNLDKIIVSWYQRINPMNPKKTREEWEKIIKKFFNETER